MSCPCLTAAGGPLARLSLAGVLTVQQVLAKAAEIAAPLADPRIALRVMPGTVEAVVTAANLVGEVVVHRRMEG